MKLACRKHAPAILACTALLTLAATAAPKSHLVVFGTWTAISLPSPDRSRESGKPPDIKIRPLYVDGHTKEFTVGLPHDVTDRAFVVQRIYRMNDSLPQEPGPAKWRWQLDGWLLVDRVSGKIQPVALPDYDPDFSRVIWFQDYAAYCGTSGDVFGSPQKAFTLIVQLGRRKPLLKKAVP